MYSLIEKGRTRLMLKIANASSFSFRCGAEFVDGIYKFGNGKLLHLPFKAQFHNVENADVC